MKLKKHLALVAALALTMVSGLSAQTGVSTRVGNGVEVGEPVTPVEINVDLRNLPTVQDWRPGQPIKEAQRRVYRPLDVRAPHAPSDWVTAPDRLGELQATFDSLGASRNESTSRVSINNGSTGVSPGDPVVEVNANYVMYGINGSTGTTFTVYNKTGTKLAGPTAFKTLAPAGDPCATSVSDPIIHWDRLANRWFMLEMGGTSSANRLCVYVSKTDNPVSGGWWFYGFATPDVPDYPHCSVWHNAYVCTTNEGSAGAKVYAFDRANMLTGATARAAQRFTSVAKLTGYGFQALTPATFMGTATNAPPAGSAVILARHNDDEAHAGTGANTTADFIDLYALNINWTTPASSNITTLPRIQITEFNSWFRDYSSFATVPQPGSTSLLDPIREVILNSMTYRNMGSYESIVGNFATNQNAARSGTVVDAGIRWFELRRVGAGNWTLQQEGTFSPGDSSTHHLLGALATDKMGNIGMSYNVTKTTATTVSASLKYTGRLVTDANGVMSQGENTIAAGSAAETSGRWGDYHQTVVDPADDCTFWTVGMYRPAGSWNTSIRDFKFSNCGGTPPVYYSISGQVTTSTGVGISGVTVSTGSASAATDASGNYTIANLVAGSYTITPSASGYTFSPVNRAVTIGSANVTGQNFTGTAAAVTYSISGTVATSGSVGISGVTVSTGSASATTNASGAYTISGLANGSYTLTPSLAGYTFSPTSLAATVSGANLTGRNFTGTASGGGATALSNGVGAAGSTASTSANSNWKDYTVAIPAGATNLTIATSGASGDVDLYVKAGAQATLTVYDCRPYTGTGNESCPFATPTAGTYYVRVYGYATGTVNFTVTASWTVGGGGGTVVERMVNGNFDAITTSGNSGTGWTRSAFTGTSFNTLLAGQTNAQTPSAYAYLGVNATTSTQTVDSNATLIPATATTATLSFFTSIVTSETSTTTAYDKLQVQLIDTSNNAVLATLVTLSNVNKTTSASTYVQRSYSVAAYKGKTVKVRLKGSTDSSLATTFRVDTVSLLSN